MSQASSRSPDSRPNLGFGLGLRRQHYNTILEQQPAVDWFEVLTENYLIAGGKPLHFLDRVRSAYPVVMHGVGLSIGGSDPLNMEYLRQVKCLAERIEPHWISDHLCWTGAGGLNMHDLLPLPYAAEAVQHVVERIQRVQDFLGRRILLENVSSYVTYANSALTEWEFLGAVADAGDCLILLDINNIFVSARNHGFDPLDYLDGVPAKRVWQHHLAGHTHRGDYLIDTHDHPVVDGVWDLYAEAVRRFGPVSTMIERDDDIPPLGDLLAELEQARRIAHRVALEKAA
ncbi:MAG: MNIO family bufferin maturase [Lysobacterales bacterium]